MKKLLGILVLALLIGGYYFYDKNKKLNKAKFICKDHFETSDQKCIDNYKAYAWNSSYQIAEKKLPEYKKKVQEIEAEIDELKNTKPDINLLEYSYTAAHEIERDFYNKLENKKIIIAGGDPGGFLQPSCPTWRLKFDYYVCLTQRVYTEDGDGKDEATLVEISNMNKFPKIKKIIDELNSYNFEHYKTTVYGRIIGKELIHKIIEADYIILERFDLDDSAYKSALRPVIYSIKKKEFLDYMKTNYPKEKINTIF